MNSSLLRTRIRLQAKHCIGKTYECVFRLPQGKEETIDKVRNISDTDDLSRNQRDPSLS